MSDDVPVQVPTYSALVKTLDNFLVAFGVGFLGSVSTFLLSNAPIDASFWKTTIGIGIVTALGIYKDKNVPLILRRNG